MIVKAFIVDSKMQTSILELEKLYNTKAGANFVYPSSRHRDHEKVHCVHLLYHNFQKVTHSNPALFLKIYEKEKMDLKTENGRVGLRVRVEAV